MKSNTIFILLAAFCLLAPYTLTAQESYAPQSYSSDNYYEPSEPEYSEKTEKSYNYGGEPTYHEETTYKEYSEKTEQGSYYAPPSYGSSNYGSGSENYDEEYSEYSNENYNYNSGSYGGSSSSYSNSQPNTSYTSSQGYSGSYDSSKPTSVPKFPSSLLTGFVVDIHILAVDVHFQYIAYHYCSDLFPGYTQCAIYNGTDVDSRLVATEFVVSAEIFATLPMEERKLYHSHAFSVKNGLLVLPGVPADQEQSVYEGVATTYGKVVDYWHSFQNFPLGPPRLAYGLADMSQINATVADAMDKSLNLGTTWQQRQAQRANWKYPQKIAGADDYLTSGIYPQYVIQQFSVDESE